MLFSHTLKFLKMPLTRLRFGPGFLQMQYFPGSNLITADNVGKKRFIVLF
jgi:hypothetical protein